jgi:hypothetical protein
VEHRKPQDEECVCVPAENARQSAVTETKFGKTSNPYSHWIIRLFEVDKNILGIIEREFGQQVGHCHAFPGCHIGIQLTEVQQGMQQP